MSTRSSFWSPEEIVDPLENAVQEIQLVSTSSDPESISIDQSEETGPRNEESMVKKIGESSSELKFSRGDDELISRSDGLHSRDGRSKEIGDGDGRLGESKRSKKRKLKRLELGRKNWEKSPTTPQEKKDGRLEEINRRLTKELEEKNAILSILQENYERLLFKYAEARNRIDELRFKCETENSHFRMSRARSQKCGTRPNGESCWRDGEDGLARPDSQLPVGNRGMPIGRNATSEEPSSGRQKSNSVPVGCRPSSLDLENRGKMVERDLIQSKAATPTDSEGLSSIITSMSGHSKILNCLNEENQMDEKSGFRTIQNPTRNFILGENSVVSDPFDKVKNWQNSLPPLEQIETPETTLYNVFPKNAGASSSGGTKYKEISSPKIDSDYEVFVDESCPASWREDGEVENRESGNGSRRARSLPNGLLKNVVLGGADGNVGKMAVGGGTRAEEDRGAKAGQSENGSSKVRIRPKRPLVRCSSLPDGDFAKREIGIHIPPLDLRNLTLSDEESYCQQEHHPPNETSSDRSIQTPPQAFTPGKASAGEGDFSAVLGGSIAPVPDLPEETNPCFDPPKKYHSRMGDGSRHQSRASSCADCRRRAEPRNLCQICGESISENGKNCRFSMGSNRSISFENVRGGRESGGIRGRSSSRRNRTFPNQPKPFKRSVSFDSEEEIPSNRCCHNETRSKNLFSITSQETFENFDVFATDLRNRSQAVMKALTAHINNS